MNTNKSKLNINWVVLLGVVISIIITVALSYHLLYGSKAYFLTGQTSHGHYQIELNCQSCHSQGFSGKEEMQVACESCHAKALDKSNDSHPKSAFTDPRNAELLQQLDARYCVTCHREHKPEITRKGGVTLASDFCFHCHQQIFENRPSHKDFEFDTCASSGCHNFHDNSMLYEKFLQQHIEEPVNNEVQKNHPKTSLKKWLKKQKKELIQTDFSQADLGARSFTGETSKLSAIYSIKKEWISSVHAQVSVNCSDCHAKPSDGLQQNIGFITSPGNSICENCHQDEYQSLVEGKHGMRLAAALEPMSTVLARGEFKHTNDKSLSCVSCHNPHVLDTESAAVDACLGCHNDEHSKNYLQSAHFALWQNEVDGKAEKDTGVSCATCHLPRLKKGSNVTVDHNQNQNLRPNSKMLRQVCMNCHGLEFSLAALAEKELINSNFTGLPSSHHQTFELIKLRLEEKNDGTN